MYNINDLYLYEILDDYHDADTPERKDDIFTAFCSSVWNNPNKRRTYKRSIHFVVAKKYLDTSIGQIFDTWSDMEYTMYKQSTKELDYASLIRQKINNIYSTMFDPQIVTKTDYMDLLKLPKRLYYRWVHGEEFDPDELTQQIDDALEKAEDLKEKYGRQKMSLTWGKYKKVIEGYMRKCFDNYRPLDEIDTWDSNHVMTAAWSEDAYCVSYFSKSLNGSIKDYQKKYYGLYNPGRNKHVRFVYCQRCGNLIMIKKSKDQRTKYCEGCKDIIKKEKYRKYNNKRKQK